MIDVQNLSKDYVQKIKEPGLGGALKGLIKPQHKLIHAVRDLSFHIEEGEIVGFIGPNGAGKSTTIKMMSGILTPTEGSVLIDGRDISKYRKEVVRNIGVVFGQRTQLNWDLRLSESFELLKHIYQVEQADYDRTLDELDGILGIKEIIDKPVRQMSLGQRVKGDLVASMIHAILTIDDIPSANTPAIVDYLNEKGIINHGVMVEDGNLSQIVDRIAPYKTLVVEYYDEDAPRHPGCEMTEHEGNVAKYRFLKKEITAAEIIADLSEKKAIKDVSIEEAGIDDIIKIAYGE